MRKTLFFGLAALLFGLLSTACADQLVLVDNGREDASSTEGLCTITATLESSVTKTTLDGMNVVWQTGDKIKVFSDANVSGVVYTLNSGAGTTTGTFIGDPVGEGPYYAVYPASAITSKKTTTLIVTAPVIQGYVANNFAQNVNLAVAKGDDLNNLSFRNAGGLLKLSVTGSKTINAVNLYSAADEALNGTLTVSDLTAETPTMTYTGSGEDKNMISLKISTPVTLSGTATDFYFFLPSGTLTSGFAVELVDSQGNAMLQSTVKDNSIARSCIREMPAFEYSPQYRGKFLLDDALASAWTGVKTDNSQTRCAAFLQTAGQFATVPGGSDSQTFRIQDWSIGYALSLTLPGTLTFNGDHAATVKVFGTVSGISPGSSTLKFIKQHGSRKWLVDETSGVGYIIR